MIVVLQVQISPLFFINCSGSAPLRVLWIGYEVDAPPVASMLVTLPKGASGTRLL